MHRLLSVLTILTVAGPVRADPCADARKEIKAKDLARASIDAAACGDDALIADVEARAEKAGYSPVEVVTDPEGATVVVEPAPDRPFAAPLRVWLPPGRHTVTALVDGVPVVQTIAIAKDGNRTSALLDLPAPVGPSGPGVVDMGEEGGGEMRSGPPPDQKMPSLLPERYQQGVDARVSWDDPVWPSMWRRPWQVAVGFTAGTGLGGTITVERAIGRHHWVLEPVLGVTVVRASDATVWQGHAGAMVAWRERVFWARDDVYFGGGLGGSLTRGEASLAGAGAEVLGEAEYVRHSGLAFGLQAHVTALTSADRRFLGATIFVGDRW